MPVSRPEQPPDRIRFVLDHKPWKAFIAILDRPDDHPASDKPRLRELFKEPHAAERRS